MDAVLTGALLYSPGGINARAEAHEDSTPCKRSPGEPSRAQGPPHLPGRLLPVWLGGFALCPLPGLHLLCLQLPRVRILSRKYVWRMSK